MTRPRLSPEGTLDEYAHGRVTAAVAPFPSVAVYLGPDRESFSRAFAPLGPVFLRVAG